MAKNIRSKQSGSFEPIVVMGCLIEPNTVYEVVPREPNDKAPEIYREMGSMKERHPGVSNSVDLTQGNTGFFPDSPSFNNTDYRSDWKKRADMAKRYYEVFAEPMKMYLPEIERIKVPTDNDFFDKAYVTGMLTADVGEGIQFNTENILDRFKLYVAIQEGQLAMKGKRTDEERKEGLKDEWDPVNQDAQYCYISITERKVKKEQDAQVEMDTVFRFMDLLRKDKEVLSQMLSYIGIKVSPEAPDAAFNVAYKNNIESNKSKFKDFLFILERFDSDSVGLKRELDLLAKVVSPKGKELIKKDGVYFYYKGTSLGSNSKSMVAALMKPENADLLKSFELDYDFD